MKKSRKRAMQNSTVVQFCNIYTTGKAQLAVPLLTYIQLTHACTDLLRYN